MDVKDFLIINILRVDDKCILREKSFQFVTTLTTTNRLSNNLFIPLESGVGLVLFNLDQGHTPQDQLLEMISN